METGLSDAEFAVLNYLDIFKYVTDIEPIKISSGLEEIEIKSILEKLRGKGYIERKTGEGNEVWSITAAGEKAAILHRQFMFEKTGRKESIIRKCMEFEELNVKFKELVTNWQMRIIDGVPVINDHNDPDYDNAILGKIFSLHMDVKTTLNELTSFIPMYKGYVKRLDYAINKLKKGETSYLTRERDSYHNVWFELHESILKLWGKERAE